MQGDQKVDDLMRPVNAAIKRHVKDGAAVTDIYNRAYEALMISMDVKAGKTYCAYCGAEYPLDDDAATLVSEHIKTCEKHPMRAVEARAEAAEAQVAALAAALQAANEDATLQAEALGICIDAFSLHDVKYGDMTIAEVVNRHRARVGGGA